MKKLVCITIILSIVLALGITESALLSKYYKSLYLQLEQVNEILLSVGDGGDLSPAQEKANAILNDWRRNEVTLHTVCNHSIVRNFEEKLVTLVCWIENDGYSDSRALCVSAMEVAKELAKESRPQLGNLF